MAAPLVTNIHRWKVEDFRRLKQLELLRHLRCELLNGELYELSDSGGSLHGGPHRWTYEDYLVLCSSDAFPELNVELIDGELVNRPRPSAEALSIGTRLADRFVRAFANREDGIIVKTRLRLQLDYQTALCPDVAVLYHPPAVMGQKEWLLLVDFAEGGSDPMDDARLGVCGRHRVAEHWRVNLAAGEVLSHRHPKRNWLGRLDWSYETSAFHTPGDVLRPLMDSSLRIPVAELLR